MITEHSSCLVSGVASSGDTLVITEVEDNQGSVSYCRRVNNSVPESDGFMRDSTVVTGVSRAFNAGNAVHNLVRVIPTKDFPTTTLGRPADSEAFVTTALALDGLQPNQIARRLAIPDSHSFSVIQFPVSSVQSIKVPQFSDKPGFIPGGFTKGGAPEFIIPNGPFPEGCSITTISNT